MNPQSNPQSAESSETASPVADPPGGDHDQPYTWGRPATTYLTYRQVVRLTILRSKLEDVRMERIGLVAPAAQNLDA